jgi:hypothetical protein
MADPLAHEQAISLNYNSTAPCEYHDSPNSINFQHPDVTDLAPRPEAVARMASPKSSLTNMSSDEKQYDTVERVEVLGANAKRKGYRPINGAQQSLDRSINLKLDCIVVILLAIDFLVGSSHRGATSDEWISSAD